MVELVRAPAYVRAMRRLHVHVLLLVAMLMLPFGMAGMPATAAHAAPQASMPISHCPDNRMDHGHKAGIAECAMPCAAALPAADFPGSNAPIIVCEATPQLLVQRLRGLHPDTATPPPKHS